MGFRLGAPNNAVLIFLPPYSPDLNPIEQLFAKINICCAARRRESESLWRKLGDLLGLVAPKEYANYLRNSGYVSV